MSCGGTLKGGGGGGPPGCDDLRCPAPGVPGDEAYRNDSMPGRDIAESEAMAALAVVSNGY